MPGKKSVKFLYTPNINMSFCGYDTAFKFNRLEDLRGIVRKCYILFYDSTLETPNFILRKKRQRNA